jgi:penicillin G amidase
MQKSRHKQRRGKCIVKILRRTARGLAWLLLAIAVLLAIWAAWVWALMGRSLPALDGAIDAPVSASVSIARDASGVPVITAATRADAAYALGFLHGQERMFQMDTLRRAAAGELGLLTGSATRAIDDAARPHRFRARARAIVAALAPADRAMLQTYATGVNAGVASLRSRPWEYGVLFTTPAPWQPEDSILAAFAMYLNLQPALPQIELDRAVAQNRGGRALADFLFQRGSILDSAMDGSVVPAEAMPAALHPGSTMPAHPAAGNATAGIDPEARPGSNNWAVGGALTSTGAALVANDMHLGLGVPSIWYRVRIIIPGALDATGVTLPGTAQITQGSNGKIAWAYTNSYIDTADAVIIDAVPGRPGHYQSPQGPLPIRRVPAQWCGRLGCEAAPIDETIWGPIVATDAFGRHIAMRWTAHQPDAIKPGMAMALETAGTVAEALAIAHTSAIPQQNFTVGDSAGNVAWTIIGQVPQRFGFDGRDAVSFADGSKGWRGMVPAAAVPVVLNPADHRIWTANNRVLGGAGYALLGDGGADAGTRAARIRELLLARDRFAPADFLAIQLDDRNARNGWWRTLLLAELARRHDPAFAAITAAVQRAGLNASPQDRGYWHVAEFRAAAIRRIYTALLGQPDGPRRQGSYAPGRAEDAARRLLVERPAALLPAASPAGGAKSWDALIDGALADTLNGDAPRFAAAFNRAGVRHALGRLLAPVGWLTDPADVDVPGDTATVRAHAPGFGASERSAVSPGHESDGIFHMPGGQTGNPRSPYHLAGHQDWVAGRPAPYLPGKARWTLTLKPRR